MTLKIADKSKEKLNRWASGYKHFLFSLCVSKKEEKKTLSKNLLESLSVQGVLKCQLFIINANLASFMAYNFWHEVQIFVLTDQKMCNTFPNG